jgi:bla regulator protein BlaR1
VKERERACDEDVLRLGSEPQVYAEGILSVCKFYVESPLTCVAGVTGPDLRRRVELIMRNHVGEPLNTWRKLFLATAGVVAVALPVVLGLVTATPSHAQSQAENTAARAPVYEVASVKPNKSSNPMMTIRLLTLPDGFSATGVTLQMLIQAAYAVEDNQISAVPNWLSSEKYDIEAKLDESGVDDLQKLSQDQRNAERRRMLQALLADRFKLTLHRETKDLPVYALVIAKNGPKLQEAKLGDTYPNGIQGPDGHGIQAPGGHGGAGLIFTGKGQLTFQGLPIRALAGELSRQLGSTVLDKTGLSGIYDFKLQWTPDDPAQSPMFKGTEGGQPGTDKTPSADSIGPSIFTALREQLGLKLESQKGPVEILVIDHVEKPSEN